MINLTTPWDPGSADPSASYTHAEVSDVSFNVARKSLNLTVMYGTEAAGVFTEGKANPLGFRIADNGAGGTDYTDFEALTAVDGTEKCLDAYKRALCQWLIDKNKLAGTVV